MGKTAKASSQGLEKVKQAALKKGWRKTSPAFLDAACVSAATLKRFWRGVPISLDSFRSICQAVNVGSEQVIAAAANDPTTLDSAPAISAIQPQEDRLFRQSLRQSLRTQLLNSARILAITGLPGIGKKTLAQQIASDLEVDGYTCIHLSCDSAAPLTLAAIAHTVSKAGDPSNFAFNFLKLQNRLASQKYLFIIDRFEHLLENNVEIGWGNLQSPIWRNFFQTVLERDDYASRFLLTSEDVPNEIGRLCWRCPERWHLCGLTELTHLEQLSSFQKSEVVQPELLQSVARLKKQIPDAFRLLGVASHHVEPISTLTWVQMGQGIELSPVRCRVLLDVLCDRAFLTPIVQDNRLHYQIHPLVRSLMLTQIQ